MPSAPSLSIRTPGNQVQESMRPWCPCGAKLTPKLLCGAHLCCFTCFSAAPPSSNLPVPPGQDPPRYPPLQAGLESSVVSPARPLCGASSACSYPCVHFLWTLPQPPASLQALPSFPWPATAASALSTPAPRVFLPRFRLHTAETSALTLYRT
ncbi:hypothetical protein P7K49_018785 [Saguinus oedipus]|uniref:Uncharacterized protein n=1 Tax=Saguinus oedipus TaxID=9490 RepID=A0ABQ9V6C3_SAGOE|nr:hypothetical protein P7K49_018785 [Saguinus oedipus]